MAEAGQDAAQDTGQNEAEPAPPRRKGRRMLVLGAGALVLLLAGAGAAYEFIPEVGQTARGLLGKKPEPGPVASLRPMFIDLPEMAVTLPNGGRSRQMRIRLSLELAKNGTELPQTEILSPRVYDALLTYLRTLRDGEVDGGLAIDRLRADLYRRLDLVLGPGVIRDVLITGLVLA